MTEGGPAGDDATLEALREQSGLRLDAEGRFWHRTEPVEHERTRLVLHQGLHRAPDGRWATRIGREWAYVEVEDAARFVRRIEEDAAAPGSLRLWLLTGEELRLPVADLAAAGLLAGAADALYLRLPGGERAKLTRAAWLSLAPRLHEGPDGFALELAGVRIPIGRDGGPEPVRPPAP